MITNEDKDGLRTRVEGLEQELSAARLELGQAEQALLQANGNLSPDARIAQLEQDIREARHALRRMRSPIDAGPTLRPPARRAPITPGGVVVCTILMITSMMTVLMMVARTQLSTYDQGVAASPLSRTLNEQPQVSTLPTDDKLDVNETPPSSPRRPSPAADSPIQAHKRVLESRAFSGHATLEDLKALRSICTNLGDIDCRDRANELISRQ